MCRAGWLATGLTQRSTKRRARPLMRSAALSALTTAVCAIGHAQPIPTDASARLQREQEERERLRLQFEQQPLAQLAPLPTAPATRLPIESNCIVIDRVVVEPALLTYAAIDRALAGPARDDSPIRRCVGAEGIALLAERVRVAFVQKGYVTTTVSVAAQDLGAGELKLAVEPGRVNVLRCVNTRGDAACPIATAGIDQGSVLNVFDIVNVLETLERGQGAQARVEIAPAQLEGFSDVIVAYTAPQALSLIGTLDDSGPRSTGRWQLGATVGLANVLGWAETAHLNVTTTLDRQPALPRNATSATLNAEVPLQSFLLGVTLGLNDSYQTIEGSNVRYRFASESRSAEVRVTRVVHRDSGGKLTAGFGFFARSSSSLLDDTEIQVQRRRTGGWMATLNYQGRTDALVIDGTLRYRAGTGAFGALPAPEEAFGEGTSRLRVFTGGLAVRGPLDIESGSAFSAELRIQRNLRPLTPQDQFCLGGRGSVHGFGEDARACSNAGVLLRGEVSVAVASLAGIRAFWALDVVRNRGRDEVGLPPQLLAGMALGVRGQVGNSVAFDTFVAQPLRRPDILRSMTSGPVAGIAVSWAVY